MPTFRSALLFLFCLVAARLSASPDIEWQSLTAPTTLTGGSAFEVAAVVKNTGTTAWTSNIYLTLRDASGAVLVAEQVGGVLPGQIINKRLSYPLPDLGTTYSFTIQALENNVAYFGPTFVRTVTVSSPLPAVSPSLGLLNVGDVARFQIVNTSFGFYTYQWRRDGVPLTGATLSQYAFKTTSVRDTGKYDVVITSLGTNVTAAFATLSFADVPLPSTPAPQFMRLGDPLTLRIIPEQNPSSTYQWIKDGSPLSGATNSLLSFSSITATDLANYSILVGDGVNPAVSRGPAAVRLRGNGTVGRKFFAVGAAGKILRSDNGTSWIAATSGVSTEVRGVASTGDSAVAVGTNGVILTSSDGASWTQVPLSSLSALNGIAAGPDRYVVVGDAGLILASSDRATWFVADSKTNSTLYGIAYGKGLYVAVGTAGRLFTAPDGFAWTNRNSSTTADIRFVTFAGDRFWALTATSQLLTSSNGIDWTASAISPPSWIHALAYDGLRYVAVGEGGKIASSADGISWAYSNSGILDSLLSITWSGWEVPISLQPASALSNLNFRLLDAPLAVSATLGSSAQFTVNASGGSLTYQWTKSGTPISGATSQAFSISQVQVSDVADYGVTVTSALGTLTTPSAPLRLVGSGPLGSQFIAVGDASILASSDGQIFQPRLSETGRVWRAVAASAFRAIAVGNNNAVALSSDGASWTTRSLLIPGNSRQLRGLAANSTQFIAVGTTGTILLSTDQGDNWQLISSPTSLTLSGIAWSGSAYLAVGDAGTILKSDTGLTWIPLSSPTTEHFYSIARNGPNLVAVTNSGQAFETANSGQTWTPVTPLGAPWVRGSVAGSGGQRILIGDRGLIALSVNSSSFGFLGSPTTNRLYGAAWTGIPISTATDLASAISSSSLHVITDPQPTTVGIGGTATFAVTATGVGPLTYQWRRNGQDLPGAVSPTLILANIQPADAGAFSVVVNNAAESKTSASATLTVTGPVSGTPPTITSDPESRDAILGGTATFSVVASGAAPLTYAWQFNGQPIPGAATSLLSLTNIQLANAGSYAVVVRNSYGSVTSQAASLRVTAPTGGPVITQQPVGLSVQSGTDVRFDVSVSGNAPFAYQWRKNGTPLSSATLASLTLLAVTSADAASYSVVVTNGSGSATSDPAGLTVVPLGTTADHRQTGGVGYRTGAPIAVRNTLKFTGTADALAWEVLLPTGWSFASASGAVGDVGPHAGDTGLLGWAWSTPTTGDIVFTYLLNPPASAGGTYTLSALATIRQGGVPIRLVAKSDPLLLVPADSVHSADTDGDHRISLIELTRVIELYNTRNGTVRTGAYTADDTLASEDGFIAAPTRLATDTPTLSRYHSSDYSPKDAKIGLFELTRIIQLYNYRTGTVRTGQYHRQDGTEGGFDLGP